MSYEHASINLADRGLVLVEGENHDSGGSNGAGKSAIFEGLLWGLYGRTVRYGASSNKVCRAAKGETLVYMELELQGQLLRIYRHRGHSTYGNKLLLFVDQTDRTRGTDVETQVLLNEYLQMDLDTFKSAVMFPQGAEGFASLTDSSQKSILESLLGMQRFADAQELAKARQNKISSAHTSIRASLAQIHKAIEEKYANAKELQDKEAEFEGKKQEKLKELEGKLAEAEANRPSFDPTLGDRYQALVPKFSSATAIQARQLSASVEARIRKVQSDKDTLAGSVSAKQETLASYPQEPPPIPDQPPESYKQDYDRMTKQITAFETQIGLKRERFVELDLQLSAIDSAQACTVCGQAVSQDTKRKMAGNMGTQRTTVLSEIQDLQKGLDKITADYGIVEGFYYNAQEYQRWEEGIQLKKQLEIKRAELADFDMLLTTLRISQRDVQNAINEINAAQAEAAELKRRSDEQDASFRAWQEQLNNFRVRIEEKSKETSPYADLIKKALAEADSKRRIYGLQVTLLEEFTHSLETLNFWIEGFGNKGVKSLLLDTVTPALNKAALEYLQYLTDGAAQVVFNTQTTLGSGEVRERFNVSVDYKFGASEYSGVSGGERRRVDIAVLFALGDLAASRANSPVHLRLLDEPFESLDSVGNEQVVRLLKEKIVPRSKTVLVMTHDENLKSLFDQRISIVKQNGVSRIEENV